MQLFTHAPTGPWPILGPCPCCGGPWPHPGVPIGPSPFEPFMIPEYPELERYVEPPSPFVLEVEPELPTLALSGVGIDFLLFLAGVE